MSGTEFWIDADRPPTGSELVNVVGEVLAHLLEQPQLVQLVVQSSPTNSFRPLADAELVADAVWWISLQQGSTNEPLGTITWMDLPSLYLELADLDDRSPYIAVEAVRSDIGRLFSVVVACAIANWAGSPAVHARLDSVHPHSELLSILLLEPPSRTLFEAAERLTTQLAYLTS